MTRPGAGSAWVCLIAALLGCQPDGKDTSAGPVPLLTRGPLNPFPNADLIGVDHHVAIPDGALPAVEGGTPWDVARFNWREGYSVVQTSVAMFDVAIDPETLNDERSLGIGGAVRMVDLTTGAELPVFAELDAYPDAITSGARALLVRPMVAMTPGDSVAVVVTTAVHTTDGAPLSTEDWAAQVEAGGHAATLQGQLDGLGLTDVAYAWDFPIADGTLPTRTLAAEVSTPTSWRFDRVQNSDTDGVPPGAWVQAEGSFTADNWLADDVLFVPDGGGIPQRQGTTESYLFVHIPEAVRGAAPGTVPVVLFGHGILSEPDNYLGRDDDPSNVLALSEALGAIFIATKWRGLTTDDLVHAVDVAGDFGRFAEIPDMLTQGVGNNLSLLELVHDGDLLDDPVFMGLADPDRIWWYGISLGSIAGMVTLANQTTITRATLHVGGSDWSTMLERSSDWPAFEQAVVRGMPDPYDRQLAYAASQLLWDPVDPASYAAELSERAFLWQEAIGDNQVPNIATELMMRSAGVPLGTPAVTTPYGIPTVALPVSGPVFTQFDPALGIPDPVNRPSPDTHAHEAPRMWLGCLHQTEQYFESDGEVATYCGDSPCSATNQGE